MEFSVKRALQAAMVIALGLIALKTEPASANAAPEEICIACVQQEEVCFDEFAMNEACDRQCWTQSYPLEACGNETPPDCLTDYYVVCIHD